MPWRMKIHGTGHEIWPAPKWLEAYDLDIHQGVGLAVLTSDPERAMPFPSVKAVLETWNLVSPSKPIRDDGRPNKPLTAYTIQPEKVPDGD